ncbi:MAG: hypothetical protein A2Y07_01000 [Planctomycetes bacterium GWF2_50_10]|nr:MAG: hypothetical protein A2Y07_01000 [Planctomycetes bacterium GWF2_50_10]
MKINFFSFAGLILILPFTQVAIAETLGQKVLHKYHEQAENLAYGSIGSVEFREYEPDANVPNILFIKLRLACQNLRNLDLPSNVRQLALADCNAILASGGNDCGDYIITYWFDHVLRNSVIEETEDFKTNILEILESANFSKSDALKAYNTARLELMGTKERDLWMLVFTFDKKKLVQLEDPILAIKYARILKSNPAYT